MHFAASCSWQGNVRIQFTVPPGGRPSAVWSVGFLFLKPEEMLSCGPTGGKKIKLSDHTSAWDE